MYILVLFVFSMTRPEFLLRHFAEHLNFLNEGIAQFIGWKLSNPFLAKQRRTPGASDKGLMHFFRGHVGCLDFGGSFWEAVTFDLRLLSFQEA